MAYTPNALPSAANEQVGLKQQASFTVLSWQYLENSAGGLNATLAEVGYDATKTSTTIKLPGFDAGYLDALSSSDATYAKTLLLPKGGIGFTLLRPGAGNPFLALTHTSAGYSTSSNLVSYNPDPPLSVLAYGTPTPSGGIPSSGTANFAAWGPSLFDYTPEGYLLLFFGSDVSVDFGARTISGRLAENSAPGYPASAPKFEITLSPSTINADGTFSGIARYLNATGTYQGRFTGPQGQEIMLRFSVNYPGSGNPGFISKTSGVLVGKR